MIGLQQQMNIIDQLKQRGWRPEDLVIEPATDGDNFRPDLVLCYHQYPLAFVEVLPPTVGQLDGAVEQLRQALERWPDINVGLVVDGSTMWVISRWELQPRQLEQLPTPDELLGMLDLLPHPGDPRFAQVVPPHRPSLQHIITTKRVVDAVEVGKQRGYVIMPAGSGKHLVMVQVIAKLLHSGFAQRVVYVTDRRKDTESLEKFLRSAGVNISELRPTLPRTVVFLTTSQLRQNIEKVMEGPSDCIVLDVVSPSGDLIALVDQLQPRFLLSFFQFIRSDAASFGDLIDKYSLREAFAAAEREPPAGYVSYTLRDLATLKTGVIRSLDTKTLSTTASDDVLVVTGNDLRPDGSIDTTELTRIPRAAILQELGSDVLQEDATLAPGDILISSWVSADGTTKVVQVPETIPSDVVWTNRLLRARIEPQQANSVDVFAFLRSDIGQQHLRRFEDKTRISLSDLGQVPVFLPGAEAEAPSQLVSTQVVDDFSAAAQIIRQLTNNVVPALQQLQSDDEDKRAEIGAQLQHLASLLLPRSLDDLVLNNYPTPIALAYRAYQESRFNVYEQVLRLRDLFESVAFFIYHVVLADAVHHLRYDTYGLTDSKDFAARDAYDGFSTAHRMTFVELIVQRANSNRGTDLFVPELVQGDIVQSVRKLQADFRNVLSHTATPNQRQIKRVVDQYWPIAEQLLQTIDFLGNYRLARVPSFYYANGVRKAQLELYRGVSPFLAEELLDANIDHDHLVLLNTEQQFLDLYPFYQRIDITFKVSPSDKIRDETHLCVFKYRKSNTLHYESINGAFEIGDTSCANDFKTLVKKLKPPTETASS